jgi:hypothetical protein
MYERLKACDYSKIGAAREMHLPGCTFSARGCICQISCKERSVRGWIILDSIIGVSGSCAIVSGLTHSAGIKSVSLLALTLLAVNLSAKLIRARA